MHNVSRTLRGQYSSSGSLRVVVGSLCVAMCVPVFAANGASATAGTPTTQFSGETMRDAYLKTKLGREERRIERNSRLMAEGETAAVADPEPEASVKERRDDHRSLKRALVDGGDAAAAAERRKNLTREERRALKRELRDALQGANSDESSLY